jgi:GNAT superfamily N-acetyltransferase
MGFEIRQATPDDAPAACALLRRSIEHGCVADHAERPEILQAWLSNKTPHNVATWFGSQTNHAVVAQAVAPGANGATELVGLALVNQAGRLALCYVDPAWVRHGVGSALLARLEHQQTPYAQPGFGQRLLRAPRLRQLGQGPRLLRPGVRFLVETCRRQRPAGAEAFLQL